MMARLTQKLPRSLIEFRITLYALKEYKGWTDEDIAKRIGTTDRTIRRMRHDPYAASGAHILKVQELLEDAKKDY